MTGSPPEFLDRLRAYYAPLAGTPFHAAAMATALENAHFTHYLDAADRHRVLAGARVLDLGTGTGGLLAAALDRGAAEVVGVEVDPAIHALAAARLRQRPAEILLTDGGAVPRPDGSFDLVFSIHVIEHTTDPAAYLADARRLLAPGGVLLVACPNRLVPREVHAELPYLPWLPIAWARRLSRWRAAAEAQSPGIRRQYETVVLVEHFFWYRQLRDRVRRAGLRILEANGPQFFEANSSSLGEWGTAHPRLAAPFHWYNETFLGDFLGPRARAHPLRRWASWAALAGSWETWLVAGRAP